MKPTAAFKLNEIRRLREKSDQLKFKVREDLLFNRNYKNAEKKCEELKHVIVSLSYMKDCLRDHLLRSQFDNLGFGS